MDNQDFSKEWEQRSETFRRTLRTLMESRGLLAKDLAYDVGITAASISRYLSNEREPTLEYTCRIAKYFGVTVDYLLGIKPEKQAVLSEESEQVAWLYDKASDDDKAVIEAVLKKYRT